MPPRYPAPLFTPPPSSAFPLRSAFVCLLALLLPLCVLTTYWVETYCRSLVRAAQENAAVGERSIRAQVQAQKEFQSEVLQKLRMEKE